MDSRTPVRLTPHRGPLATPPTSPESSPTSSTPPSDISHCSPLTRAALDVAILQYRIPMLGLPTRHEPWSHLYHWRHEVIKQMLFNPTTYLCPHGLLFENLIYSACELAKALAGIVTFCLFIWGLLEWSSYASRLPQQPDPWISTSAFPFPSPTRALRCQENPSLCEPRVQHVAVLQFLSEQIEHARALSSLSASLSLPLHAFFNAHRGTVAMRRNLPEPPHLVKQVDTLTNVTELLGSSVLDFTSGSFIGRSFTLALDELDGLISETMVLSPYGGHQHARLHAIYWRTTSNLLLEYSAARPRARRLLQHVQALHRQLSPLVGPHVVESTEKTLGTRWWRGMVRHPTTSVEERMQALVTGLEITLGNIQRLIAYLDWTTERLAQTTLKDVLKTQRATDFLSCVTSLQELFAQSRPSTSKKHCFCQNDYGITSSSRLERVDIMVPGSPTVRAGR